MQAIEVQDPIRAELTLYYKLHQDKLPVTNSEHASRLFRQFAQSSGYIDGWFVIFLDKKKRFLCWHHLKNFIEIPAISADLVGFGKIIEANHIIMARMDEGSNPSVCYTDICWIASMLKCCEEKSIELNDYLVVTEKEWCSYQDAEFME